MACEQQLGVKAIVAAYSTKQLTLDNVNN